MPLSPLMASRSAKCCAINRLGNKDSVSVLTSLWKGATEAVGLK